jgi:hypothetical protein
MSTNILQKYQREVNYPKNFVPAKADANRTEPTPAEQYERGRKLYFAGKRISECRTDDMCAGCLDAEYSGRIAYLRAMQSEGYSGSFSLEVMN